MTKALVPAADLPGVRDYRAAVAAVAKCTTIPQAEALHDQAAGLAAYAYRARDTELLILAQEVRLRAAVKVGEMVLQIAPATAAGRGRYRLPSTGLTKKAVLAEAGLSEGRAGALAELAGGSTDANRQAAARTAGESFLAECRARRSPASLAKLRHAVRQALGDPPPEPRHRPITPAAPAKRQRPNAPTPAPASPGGPPMPPTLASATPTARPGADVAPALPGLPELVRLIARMKPESLPAIIARVADPAALRVEAEQAERVVSTLCCLLASAAPRHATAEVAMIVGRSTPRHDRVQAA